MFNNISAILNRDAIHFVELEICLLFTLNIVILWVKVKANIRGFI